MTDLAPPVEGKDFDVAVIGGGIVGCSIAWGLVQRGNRVIVLDEGDRAFRASRGNFGMVWVQGKGLGFPAYARLTRTASDNWQAFADKLTAASDIDPEFARPGGFGFCLSEAEMEAKQEALSRLVAQTDGLFAFDMIDRSEIAREAPWIGKDVVGAVLCPHDGGANPLKLLRGLQTALNRNGAVLASAGKVNKISATEGGYTVSTDTSAISAAKIVLAAGLGNKALAPMIGLEAPVRPVRGQILVTERLAPLMTRVSNVFRHMPEGTCLIGDTVEEAGYDESVLMGSIAMMASRAIKVCPPLGGANLVRAWGALRIMTPDGLPLYVNSQTAPGAWLTTVHSGVTLAPVHAELLAEAIVSGKMPDALTPFSPERFAAGNIADQTSNH